MKEERWGLGAFHLFLFCHTETTEIFNSHTDYTDHTDFFIVTNHELNEFNELFLMENFLIWLKHLENKLSDCFFQIKTLFTLQDE